MTVRLVVFALVAVLAAGCGDDLFGMCGLSPDSATWDDPLLHKGLPDGGPWHDTNLTMASPPPGLPLVDADLDARWDGWSLTGVWWGSDLGGFNLYPLSVTTDNVTAIYADLAEFQAHRADVESFLRNLGLSAEQATAMSNRMEVNATESTMWGRRGGNGMATEFTAATPATLTAQPAWDQFCCLAQEPSAVGGLGQVQLLGGQWAFLFALETKTLQGNGFTLDTDANGRAEFMGFAMGEGDERKYKAAVRHKLGELNLPQPDPADMHLGGSIC